MTRRVVLHVGAPKSGTTYLQNLLGHHADRLAEAGVLLASRRHLDAVHAGFVVREDPRLADLGEPARTSWDRAVAAIREWPGDTAIFSYELLAGATAEQARAAVGRFDGLDVHVVITARDLGQAVPSAWQERLKFGLTTPLEEWQPPSESAPRSEWGWRTMDPAGVAARWRADLPADRVHVVTVPRSGRARDELWHRFVAACGLALPPLDLAPRGRNQSLGLVAAELLRRVNERVGPPISGNREHALWLRDTLAHDVLAGLDDEPIGVTEEQFAEADERSRQAVAAIEAAGYDVVGDLEDLRASRRAARTPGQATSEELLAVAVPAVLELLLRVRREAAAPAEPVPGAGRTGPLADRKERGRAAGKGLLRLAVARPVYQELADAHARIDELERGLHETRALHTRLSAVSDLVTELLLPAGDRDDAVLAGLERYRQESL